MVRRTLVLLWIFGGDYISAMVSHRRRWRSSFFALSVGTTLSMSSGVRCFRFWPHAYHPSLLDSSNTDFYALVVGYSQQAASGCSPTMKLMVALSCGLYLLHTSLPAPRRRPPPPSFDESDCCAAPCRKSTPVFLFCLMVGAPSGLVWGTLSCIRHRTQSDLLQ